eukprot:10525765-Alexandrium_andersonii.AAC.1
MSAAPRSTSRRVPRARPHQRFCARTRSSGRFCRGRPASAYRAAGATSPLRGMVASCPRTT